MWTHERNLIYPLKKLNPNPAAARLILRLLDFEYGSAMCYLSQRHAMPYKEGKALLTEIGTEELGHFELIATMVHRLTRNQCADDLRDAGLSEYYLEHTLGVAPQCAQVFLSKGDPITDLHECLAKEQAARTSYDNLLRLIHDPDLIEPLTFLRERELEHYLRFSEMLDEVRECMDGQGCYAYNPAFDLCQLHPEDDE